MADTLVFYPSPGRSHLVSMTELAKLIATHHPSLSPVVIISEAPFETGSTAPYIAAVSATTPSVSFHHLPTVSLPNASSSVHDVKTLSFELPTLQNPNFHQALLTISKSGNIKALILDFFCNYSFQVSQSLNIPTFYYITGGLTGLATFLYFPIIHKNTKENLKDLDELLDIPGVPPIFAKDMPVPMLDRTRKIYQYFLETAIQMPRSAGIIVNTVETLEARPLKAILDGKCTPGEVAPSIYCLGPLLVASDEKEEAEERHENLVWLDSQPSRSVVFLSFGGWGKFSAKQLKEMAIGLERSGARFLWIVRPPEEEDAQKKITSEDPSLGSFLPEGFLERTKGRGFVAKGWAPQVPILSHESVGCFVTHCGWNSIIESIRAGVPMLAWPLYAENFLNKALVVEELKVALPLMRLGDGSVSADELEERIIELLQLDAGKAVRARVAALKDVVLGARNEHGPSQAALARLIESIKRG